MGLLIDEVTGCLSTPLYPITRMAGLQCLRDVMWTISNSTHFDHPQKRERVASMFFPFILSAVERVDIFKLQINDKPEMMEWAVCVLWILKHCNREKILCKWWAEDTQKNHVAFLQLLHTCIGVSTDEHFSRESSFIVLDVLEDYLEVMLNELASEDGPIFENYFKTLILLISTRQTTSFLSSAFFTIRRFIHRLGVQIFSWDNTSYCERLCYTIMRFTDAENVITRSEAGSLLYLIIKTNFGVRQNFSRAKLQSTIAVSRMCGESEGHVRFPFKRLIELTQHY